MLPALLLGLALADVPGTRYLLDALPPVARQQMELARAKEAAGELRRAEAGYTLVLTRAPGFVPAVMGLGRVRAAQGDKAGAMQALGSLPSEADAVEELARLTEEDDPARAAQLYQTLVVLRPGTASVYGPLARALARSGALDDSMDALETWMALSPDTASPDVFLTLGVAMREAGREDEGIVLLERALALDPQGPLAAEVRGRLDRIAVEQAARLLGLGGGEPLAAELREELDHAGREVAEGSLEAAQTRLEAVVQKAPRSSEARAALGDVLLARGSVAEAERALGWAVALEPDESEWHARLGLLLADEYGGRRHPEAADALRRALALRPAWPALQLRLGAVLQQQGAWEEALAALRACVRHDPTGASGVAARARIDDLTREAPEPPDVTTLAEPPADVPAAALEGYRIARIYLDRGDTERARAELLPVQKLAPDWTAVLNLQAALALRDGDEPGAIASWERSLVQDPAQPRVKLVLGELARRDGADRRAERLLREAATEGAPDAHYQLAAMAFEQHRLFDAREELDAFLAASTGGLNHQPARQLQRTVERRILIGQLGAGGGLLSVIGLLLGYAVWRRGRHPLEALVRAAPEASHDVARVLSSIRHEVLKHNTTLLDEVAHAIEHGDHHAVAFAAERLFGGPGDKGGGAVQRFEAYLGVLHRMGGQYGVRLDLRNCDPVLSPMWQAMGRLQALEGTLRHPTSADAGVGEALRQIGGELNDTGYQALGRLVRRLGTLQLRPARFAAVADRVRQEPGFVGRVLPALEVRGPEGGLPARVLQGDLDDVVANLVRNAWRAGATRTGVHLEEEDDPITGLEHVALRFVDDAPGALTDAMIHQRGIGRGLGLVVDLVTRHDGSICVECRPEETRAGWAKAVVVRFPRAEFGEAP